MPTAAVPFARLVLLWAALAGVVPLYALYALWFADSGLSGAEISLLFAIWSAIGMGAEVPAGVLADRFSRRGSLALGGLLQAIGYAVWTVLPDFAGFAVGFGVWGIGGAFVSGAAEALLYEGLATRGADHRFPELLARMTAVGLIAQVPAALAAALLFHLGGYPLVGWVSVGTCLLTAGVALLIPATPQTVDAGGTAGSMADSTEGTLRSAWAEVSQVPTVRLALVGVAALTGMDAIEEYVPLLAREWSIPVTAIALLGLGLPLAGAVGAALGGRAARASGRALAVRIAVAGFLLLGASVVRLPVGLLAVFVFYGIYQAVLVAAGATLQDRIVGTSRATVTSIAALAGELTAFATYVAWALGGGVGVAVLVLLVALGLPRWLGSPGKEPGSAR